MKKFFLLVLLFSASLLAQAKPDYNNWKLSLNCLGPICVGMSIEQASKITNLEVGHYEKASLKEAKRMIKESTGHCFYLVPTQKPLAGKVEFMVTNKHISTIEINSKEIKTLSGIGIGDSEGKVKKTYKGKIKEDKLSKYDVGGGDNHNFVYVAKDKADQKYKLLIVTDGKKVTSVRSGYIEEVGYIEGCL